MQHSRHRSYQAYVIQPSGASSPASAISGGGHTSSSVSALDIGRNKGKGKPLSKGNRTGTPSTNSMVLSGQSLYKGKGNHTLPKEKAHFPLKAKVIKEKDLVLLLPPPISHVYSANFVICMVTLSRIVVRNRHYKSLRPISKLVSNLLLVNS